MTTVKQVRDVVQPLLQKNPDLALVGRFIAIKPVHHILRGIYIDRCSVPEMFQPKLFGIFLFEPEDSISFRWGKDIYNPVKNMLWMTDNPNISSAICEEIERTVLPILRPVKSVGDFASFASDENFPSTPLDHYEYSHVFVQAALGDFTAALEICAHLMKPEVKRSHYLFRVPEDYDRVMDVLYPLLKAGDRLGVAEFLHACEAFSVEKLKLEHLWEKTPFPVELQT